MGRSRMEPLDRAERNWSQATGRGVTAEMHTAGGPTIA